MSFRYNGFISYSQRDKRLARKIHRWLESYLLPRGLGLESKESRRLGNFFRDETDMSASHDIGASVAEAISNSEFLIVICSPNSAKSEWVEAEIQHFRQTGRPHKVLAVIVDGVPNSGHEETECFPPSFKRTNREGAFPVEPLAINLKEEGRIKAIPRLAAGLKGMSFDELWQRDSRRRSARLRLLLSAMTCATLLFAALSVFAFTQRHAAISSEIEANTQAVLSKQGQVDLLIQQSEEALRQTRIDRAIRSATEALTLAYSNNLIISQQKKAELALRQALMDWENSTVRLRQSYQNGNSAITKVLVSEDSNYLAASDARGTITIYDYRNGTAVHSLEHPERVVDLVSLGEQGFVSGSKDGTIVLTSWDGRDSTSISLNSRLQGVIKRPEAGEVLVFGHDGAVLLWAPQINSKTRLDHELSEVFMDAEFVGSDRVYMIGTGSIVSLGISDSRDLRLLERSKGILVYDLQNSVLASRVAHDDGWTFDVSISDLRSSNIRCSFPTGAIHWPAIDGKNQVYVAKTVDPNNLEFWNIKTCELTQIHELDSRIRKLDFDRNLGITIVATTDNTLEFFNSNSGELSVSAEAIAALGMEVDEKNHKVLLWDENGEIGVWDNVTGARILTHTKGQSVRSVNFSSSGNTVWVIGSDGELEILSLVEGSISGKFSQESQIIDASAKTNLPDSSGFLSWSSSGVVKRWDWSRERDHQQDLYWLETAHSVFSPDQRFLFFAEKSGIHRIDMKAGKASTLSFQGSVDWIIPSEDGSLATVKYGDELCLWRPDDNGGTCNTFTDGPPQLRRLTNSFVAFDNVSSFLFTSAAIEEELVILPDNALSWGTTDRAFLGCFKNGWISAFDGTTGEPIDGHEAHLGNIERCDIHSSNKRILVVNSDGDWSVLKYDSDNGSFDEIWSAADYVKEEELGRFQRPNLGDHLTLNGDRLLWVNLSSGNTILNERPERDITSVTVSPNGRNAVIVTEGSNSNTYLVNENNSADWKQLRKGYNRAIFLNDDVLLTSGQESSAYLWSVSDGKLIGNLRHNGLVRSGTYLPEKDAVATWSDNGNVRIWDVNSGSLLLDVTVTASVRDVLEANDNNTDIVLEFSDRPPQYLAFPHADEIEEYVDVVMEGFRPKFDGNLCDKSAPDDCLINQLPSDLRMNTFLGDAYEGAIEIAILNDGRASLICDRPFPDLVTLVEYVDETHEVILHSFDGRSTVLSSKVSSGILNGFRNVDTIVILTIVEGLTPLGYEAPLAPY